ncbi:5-carboxymethyl-2-hydroxymuconate semialdehyde dehydrogenase [Candidatus Poriferisodalis sp.]|uniref:5-carboxymethyl-2-hydroxymuconate semialdehyde dehydrogenase n=1 Tax=Candidatus Poriferisodalis sp. TaxID=3101277 RepID=UPI003B012638
MRPPASFAANLAASRLYLARFAAAPTLHLIGGVPAASASGSTFPNLSPIDAKHLGDVAAGDAADIDAAASAARDSFEEWSATPGSQRKRILHAVADAVEARADEIAVVESTDTGQAIRFMSSAALRGAENFRYFADQAPGASDGLALPSAHHLNYTGRRAIGPVGVITPWNTPFMLSTWKIAPALAAGCTVVHKPAEWSPLTACLLAETALEAGLPSGVLNVVHGTGETAGRALTEHPDIAAIAFVGESATGSAIQAQSAATLKRLHFELGGKNPVIVFEDADLDRALDAVLFMIYSLNGERCTSSSRLLVHRSIHDEFTRRLAAQLDSIRIGNPLDPATVIGPLIHPRHCDQVRSYIELAETEGATVMQGTGWDGAPRGGNYVAPTLFAGATNDMRIAREEIFGPVLTVIAFDDEADAVTLANDTDYGLAAYVWTSDVGRAHRMADAVDAGMVWVNSHNVRHLPTPFGGTKRSGIGRDGGDWSLDFYTETKNVAVAYDTHDIPKLVG